LSRRDSQKKPNEDFYLNFKSAFSSVGLSATNEAPATPAQTLNTAEEALDLSFNAAYVHLPIVRSRAGPLFGQAQWATLLQRLLIETLLH